VKPLPWWSRWTSAVGVFVAVVALGGLASSYSAARSRERQAADRGTASAIAGYLSLVTPVEPGSTDYQLAPLLSAAHTLARTVGERAGLQVAWHNTPLLPDTIGLTPLEPAFARVLGEGYATATAERPAGTVSIVPLFDRDQWSTVGWVAFWGSIKLPTPSPFTLTVALVMVVAIVMAIHLARPGESARHRWTSAGIAVAAMLLVAVRLGGEIEHLAARATDVALIRTKVLADRARTIPQVPEGQLGRIAPGFRVRILQDQSPETSVRRLTLQGEPLARIRVPLRSGEVLEVSTTPREAQLAGTWSALLGWVALLGLGLGFSAWAGAAQAEPRRFRETITAWGFIGPAVVHLAVFAVAPLLFAAWLSLHRWGLVEPVRPFVGLDNFREMSGDSRFWHSLGITALYSLYVPATMLVALAAALALDRSGIRVRLARTVLFLPFVSSVVAIALVWQWMYQADFGLINNLLARIGITGPDWLGDPRFALIAVMILSVWVHLGYQMVIFLAGLQGIPQVYHDAARVDGAGPWQRFRRITLPLLRPTILFVLVTGTISSFQVFTYVSVMTEGGPLHSTEVVVYRIYQEAWEFLRFGTASAMSLILFAILLLATWLQFRWLGRKVELV
jgi:ABC-type sugar transport system permease subunit